MVVMVKLPFVVFVSEVLKALIPLGIDSPKYFLTPTGIGNHHPS